MSGLAFDYRAVRADGEVVTGRIAADDRDDAVARIRNIGAMPVELRTASGLAASGRRGRVDDAVVRALIGELAVLLGAGLSLDRALALAIGNIEDAAAAQAMAKVLDAVREGALLSAAMAEHPEIFSAGDAAMAAAGEAGGRLGEALERLAAMREQAAELRGVVVSAMIYPAALMVIAVAVILMMLLFVVPQFERLLSGANGDLPAASMAVIAASRGLRAYGWWLLAGLAGAGMLAYRTLSSPAARGSLDRLVLRLPLVGELVRRVETVRLAGTLSALVEGGVPLPAALLIAGRTVSNSVIAAAIARVAASVREGGSLSRLMAEAGVLPPIALGFLRTGEETSRLALMLSRLATVLARDVQIRLERLVAILTPAITVVLGAVVATIIAAVMSAILGFNDLAVAR